MKTTLSKEQLRNVLAALARCETQPLEIGKISKNCKISPNTLKQLLLAFNTLYLIHVVPTQGNERRPVIFFEDQGEASHLRDGRLSDEFDLIRLLFCHIRPVLECLSNDHVELFQYRNRGGALIPLCVKLGGQILGFTATAEKGDLSLHQKNSAKSFLHQYSGARVMHLTWNRKVEVISEKEMICPIGAWV